VESGKTMMLVIKGSNNGIYNIKKYMLYLSFYLFVGPSH